ncbi:nucleotidyltransferase family protein [Winogradskyella sp. MIT101101]|uniref:nucleotidyltransferase family protein n=1 Tax=Winogradskyella sp. MIT101101 TaxID=3098297 RepID=UPI00399C0CA0
MGNLAVTYQNIADILSFETSNSELEQLLSHSSFNWDAIVSEGSRHLVLPALYCRLQSKELLHILPNDLNEYLEEITELNRERNSAILDQINIITEWFNKHNIEHAFLKGAALLALDCYDDIAERMIGDIDILVATDQLDLAFDLLKTKAYSPTEQTLGFDFFEHKHLPRLKTEHHICAVELHKTLFVTYKDSYLTTSNILKKKQYKNKISIPSRAHLLRHNILNYQINDKGSWFNSISFRSAYDTLILLRGKHFNPSDYNNKIYRKYFNVSGLFFNDIKVLTKSKESFLTSFYLFKLTHISFYKFWNTLLKIIDSSLLLFGRTLFFLKNKDYRKAIINDKERIYNRIKSFLSNS